MNSDYQPIGTVEEFKNDKGKRVRLADKYYAVFRLEDRFFAIDDACPHKEASLAFGMLEGETLSCPRHGAQFDITTGNVLSLPAVRGVYSYPIKVVDGTVMLKPTPILDTLPELLRLA